MSETPDSTSEFSWRAHPARERLGPALLGLMVIAIVAVVVFAFVRVEGADTGVALAWAGLGVLVLVLGLNRFFFPSRFSIDADGITARFPFRTRRFQWADIRRFAHDQYGGFLSRRARRSRWDAYSGLHILFGSARPDVIQCIRAHLGGEVG